MPEWGPDNEPLLVEAMMSRFAPQEVSADERLALLRLARTENVGPISFFHLLSRFGSAGEVLDRLPSLVRRGTPRIPAMEDLHREIEAHQARGWSLMSIFDPDYPAALRALKDPPPFLSVCGRTELLGRIILAIVGSRHASCPGERVAGEIASALSGRGWVIASGLARGIDGCVHRASLDGGGTVAVIAGGLGHIYPPEHKALYDRISQEGVILSEDPLFQVPQASLFAKRNRLISGLSWGVLVVEAGTRSGSLLTAKYAADQGRAVMAVPGHPLDFRARGVNRLIKQGACLVETADDVMQEYAASHRHLAFESDTLDFDTDPSGLSFGVRGLERASLTETPADGPRTGWACSDSSFLATSLSASSFGSLGSLGRVADGCAGWEGGGFDLGVPAVQIGQMPLAEAPVDDLIRVSSCLPLKNAGQRSTSAQGVKAEEAGGRGDAPASLDQEGANAQDEGSQCRGVSQDPLVDVCDRILALLGPSVPTSVDDLAQRLQVPAAWVRVCLVQLELGGEIGRWPGDSVTRRV